MNKTKLILPLLVAPILFGCNKNDVNGNYVVKAENITYKFTVGDESNYNNETDKDIYPDPSTVKNDIVNKFTTYLDGSKTEDSTIRLSDGGGAPGVTDSKEEVTLHDVNYHKKDEVTSEVSFSYAKTKNGYHFFGTSYDSDIGKYRCHNLQIRYHVTNTLISSFDDNGFAVENKTLTANILGKITDGDSLKYQIEFTVIATK